MIANDADGPAVEPRKTHHEIFGVVLVDFKEITIVHDGMNRVLDVVGLLGIERNERIQSCIAARGRVGSSAARRILEIIRGEKTYQLANHGQAIGIVARDKMRHAALFVVGHRAAKLLLGDFFVRDGFDDVGAGHEHVGSFLGHENEIGDRGRVHGTAGTRSHDGADLGDDAARKRVAQKNVRVTRERCHTLLDARAARIIQADDGRARPHGQVHDFADSLCVGFGERAAKNREVLCEDINQASVDAPKAGDEAIASRPLLLHAKIHAAVADQFVELLEGAFVQQQVDALSRGELAGLMLAFAALETASGFGFRVQAAHLLRAVVTPRSLGALGGFGGRNQAAFRFRQRNLR